MRRRSAKPPVDWHSSPGIERMHPSGANRMHQQQQVHDRPGHEDATDFAKHEQQIGSPLRPPKPADGLPIRRTGVVIARPSGTATASPNALPRSACSAVWRRPDRPPSGTRSSIHPRTCTPTRRRPRRGRRCDPPRPGRVSPGCNADPVRSPPDRESRIQRVDGACRVAQHAVDAHAELLVRLHFGRRLQVFAVFDGRLVVADDPGLDSRQLGHEVADVDDEIADDGEVSHRLNSTGPGR